MAQFILWLICIIYCISPVDLVPGPLDDAICFIAVAGLNTIFFGKKDISQQEDK